jgi:hypothetical protein
MFSVFLFPCFIKLLEISLILIALTGKKRTFDVIKNDMNLVLFKSSKDT